MSWRSFVQGLVFSTLIFGGLLLLMTYFVSPERGVLVIALYYISLFFFAMGFFSLMFFYYRKWLTRNEMVFGNIKVSIRQGGLLAAFVVSVLALSSMELLTWWDGAILAVSFLLVELFFKAKG